MNGSNRYIIEKQFIELKLESAVDVFDFRNELEEVCKNELIPEIEKLFDNIIPGDKLIRLDYLEIDAGKISADAWKKEFVDNVIRKISAAVDTLPNEGIISRDRTGALINEDENAENVFLFFLEKGFLPWYSGIDRKSELNTLADELMNSSNDIFFKRLKYLLKNKKKALNRLIFQFDEKILNRISKQLFSEKDQEGILRILNSTLSSLNFNSEQKKILIYGNWFEVLMNEKCKEKEDALFTEICNGILSSSEIEKYPEHKIKFVKSVSEHLKNNNDPEVFLKPLTEDIPVKDSKTDSESEPAYVAEYYINNSGLVLIHPFLVKLFENNGYTENGEWVSEKHQQRAIALMQYAVTGKEEYPEFLLMLNKILCGYEISDSLPADIMLSEFEKNEADELLSSVIGHWTALKKTTVNGLQETFLIRNGKLRHDTGGWILIVEVNTADILINKLPWGISIIKLPWMKEMMRVEWSY